MAARIFELNKNKAEGISQEVQKIHEKICAQSKVNGKDTICMPAGH